MIRSPKLISVRLSAKIINNWTSEWECPLGCNINFYHSCISNEWVHQTLWMGAGWISECEHLLAEARGWCWMLLQHSLPWNRVFHWIRSSLIGQTVWQMRPRAPPVSLLPCWGHSHPPDFPVWPPRIRTRVLMLVPRPFTDWVISHLILKATFSFIVSQLFLKMLERTRRQHPHFCLKPASLLDIRLLTPFIQKERDGW